MNTTSPSLLERLRQPSDRKAWGRFVHLYTPLIYGFACRLGVPEQDRADLVQQVFTLLLQKLPDFAYDQGKRFRGWLWSFALNQWRVLRRQHTLALVPPGGLDDFAASDPGDGYTEQEYRRYLVKRAVRLMQDEFQPNTWKAFWECVATGRPAPEVARNLNISVASVYAAKSRVLRRLRQELNGFLE